MNIYLDVDNTLLSLDGQIHNHALIKTLALFLSANDEITVNFLTRMDYDGALGIEQPLRSDLIRYLEGEGIKVGKVYTPLDRNAKDSLQPGDVYESKLKPVELALSNVKYSLYFSASDLENIDDASLRKERISRFKAYRDALPSDKPVIDAASAEAFEEFERVHQEYKSWRESLEDQETYTKLAVYEFLEQNGGRALFIDDSPREIKPFKDKGLPCISPPKFMQHESKENFISLPSFIFGLAQHLLLPPLDYDFFDFLHNELYISSRSNDNTHENELEIAIFAYICAQSVDKADLQQFFINIILNNINNNVSRSLDPFIEDVYWLPHLHKLALDLGKELYLYQQACNGIQVLNDAIKQIKVIDLPSAFNPGIRNLFARSFNAVKKSVLSEALDNFFVNTNALFSIPKNPLNKEILEGYHATITSLVDNAESKHFKKSFMERYNQLLTQPSINETVVEKPKFF